MRIHPSLVPALLLALLLATPAAAEEPTKPRKVRLEFVHLEMTGVEASEKVALETALVDVAGVRSVSWVAEWSEVRVVREAGRAGDDALLALVKSRGAATAGVVPLAAARLVFEKKLHCGGCVAAVNRSMRGVRGVRESTVASDMTLVTVVYDTRATKPADLESVLAQIGKPAHVAP